MIVEKLVRAELIYTDNHRTTHEKDMELSHIMKDMERLYGIPGTEDEEWNEKHPDVVFIYDRIRKMRSF